MAIINLGQMGQRRESALGGVPEMVSKYSDALGKAKATKAATEEARADKSRTYFREAYKNYWKKGDSEREMFDRLPEGKQFHKAAKKHIPDWYDGEGKPIKYPVEQELTPQEDNQVKIDLEKMKRGLDPSPEGAAAIVKLLQYQSEYGDMDPAEADKAIKHYMKFITNPMSKGIAGPQDVNQQDPLSILGR